MTSFKAMFAFCVFVDVDLSLCSSPIFAAPPITLSRIELQKLTYPQYFLRCDTSSSNQK